MRQIALCGALYLLILAACGADAGSEAPVGDVQGARLAPGMWEFVTTTHIAGRQAPMARTTSKCIRKDLTDPVEHLTSEQKCSVSEREEEGSTVRWKMDCAGAAEPWQGAGEITSRGTSATGHMSMRMPTPERTFEMQLGWRARRVGDC